MTTFETLWQLSLSWKCDYTVVSREQQGKKPLLSVNLHLDSCRRCALQKKLFELDEMLKNFAELEYPEFVAKFKGAGAGEMSEEEFNATKDHAQLVRGDFIGCPAG